MQSLRAIDLLADEKTRLGRLERLIYFTMNDNDFNNNVFGENPDGQAGDGNEVPQVQQFQQNLVGARLPEHIAAGVFATGAVVLQGPNEFMIDFIQAMRPPARVVSRVILSHRVMGQFIDTLKTNFQKYEEHLGPPKPAPKQQQNQQPTIQKIYEDLKLPDELLSGAYANVIMIGHSHSDFFMDFATQFYPTAAVSARVHIAASNVPGLLKTITAAYDHYRKTPDKNPPKPDDSKDDLMM